MVLVNGSMLYTIYTSRALIGFELGKKIGCQDEEILIPGKQ
jgi:hypothetical protein